MPDSALAGIRVLEVGNFVAAPFCTLQLADLGADVVKVENPDGGDQTRASGPFLEGESSSFLRLNRNKRSVALDLKAPRGKEIFRKLAGRADVLVENLRPGTMKDLQLDYPRLSEINPRLVYVAASGWGQDGPYAQRPGLDIMAQGMSGLMSITGEEGGNAPVKVGVPLTDLTCALYGALAAVAALRARERTGRGQFIDVCLFEAGVSPAIWGAGRYFATGGVPKPPGSGHQTPPPYPAPRPSHRVFTLPPTGRGARGGGPGEGVSSMSVCSRRASPSPYGKQAAISPPGKCPSRWARRTRPPLLTRRCAHPTGSSPSARRARATGRRAATCSASPS